MNNEPVAWKYKVNKNNTKTEGICTDKHYLQKDGIYDIEPLYTHPANRIAELERELQHYKNVYEGDYPFNAEPVAWIVDGKIVYPAKTLTDEEIDAVGDEVSNLIDTYAGRREFARAILRKAQEK